MNLSLPKKPSIHLIKRQAKGLLKAYITEDVEAWNTVRIHHPVFAQQRSNESLKSRFTLSDAQFVIARLYGFGNWKVLKTQVECVRLEEDHPDPSPQISFCDRSRRFPQQTKRARSVTQSPKPLNTPASA